MSTPDPHDLARFIDAQRTVYPVALAELRRGRKTTHWMWFVFPQLKALGRSPTAKVFGIVSRSEAEAYLAHPVLGLRLVECSRALLALPPCDIHAVMGSPDDLKLCSCMTLFAHVASEPSVFRDVLARFYGSAEDTVTVSLLAQA